MQTLKINKRFRDLIPALDPIEREQLEANVISNGCRDPIVVWPIRKGDEPCIDCDGADRSSETIEEKVHYQLARLGHFNIGIEASKKDAEFIWCNVESNHDDEHLCDDPSGFFCSKCGSPDYESEVDFVIVDGHHRYEICQRHNIPFEIHAMEFDDEDSACIWIIDNQFGRRNLAVTRRK